MKFTAEKPTVPGAYWWRHIEKPEVVRLTEIEADEIASLGNCSNREWSERLVPVGEVQIAFVEGACAVRHWSHLKPHKLWDSGVKIRARRVVEGKEQV